MNRRGRGPRAGKLVVVLGAAAFLAFPVPAWAALSASVANATLAAVPYSHAAQTSTGELILTAEDTDRETCILFLCTETGGWNVTLQASSFAYSGPNSGTAIPAANLVITTAHPPTRVQGEQISASGGPRTTGVTGPLDVARKTLQADEEYGAGTYRQEIDVGLTVPGGARAGTYTTTLTVTISAGP